MATFTYRIKSKANPGNIRIRVKQGDAFDYEISTGLKCRLEHWSNSKQIVKNIAVATYKDKVNFKLRKLKAFIEAEYFNELSDGNGISQLWLKKKVNQFFNRPDTIDNEKDYFLGSFIENYINESKNTVKLKLGRTLSPRTIEYYHMTLDKLKTFEEFKGKKVKFIDVNTKFHKEFVTFLSTEQQLNPNTIGFYVSKLKLFCKEADIQGVNINSEYKSSDFYVPSNKTIDIYLNEAEIKSIFELNLHGKEKLDNVRDWLIIGVWTGLRVSDLLTLKKESLTESQIHITNIKTGIPVIIPLHDQVKQILTKREGEFPRPISDQKFNSYIKTVCELAKITNEVEGSKMIAKMINGKKVFRKAFGKYKKFELVSSHVCRRSFATNLYGKLDTLTIMKITGHKTEKQFIEYIKITPSEYAKKLEEYWGNQNL